jgi:surface-anchored protein
MRFPTVLSLVILGTTSLHAAPLIEEHADLTFNYDGSTDQWSVQWRFADEFEEPIQRLDSAIPAIPVRDRPFVAGEDPQSGDRFIQPAGAAYSFTGATAGAPVWILTKTDNDYAWAGMANDHAPGTVMDGIRVHLTGMTYRGESASAHFALWDVNGLSQPVPAMTTSNGINASDFFDISEQGHHHMNWGFTAPGIYRLELQASATRASDAQPITSGSHTAFFAVGTYAVWLATHFPAAELMDTGVSGEDGDPDGDGIPVLAEYAFGLDPLVPESRSPMPEIRVMEEQRRLVMQFVRRKSETNSQLRYMPEFAAAPDAAVWDSATILSVISLDETWERVEVCDPAPVTNAARRFGRVRLELLTVMEY